MGSWKRRFIGVVLAVMLWGMGGILSGGGTENIPNYTEMRPLYWGDSVCPQEALSMIPDSLQSEEGVLVVIRLRSWIMSCPVYGYEVYAGIGNMEPGIRKWYQWDSTFVYLVEPSPDRSPEQIRERFHQLLQENQVPEESVRGWCIQPN